MRKTFSEDTGIPKNAQYAMIAVLIAVAVIGGICSEQRLAEARNSANAETSTSTSGN